MWDVCSNIVIRLSVPDMGQCCLLCMWDVCSNIVIRLSVPCGQCCLLYMWDVCSNIVIGLSVPDMWSVLFVIYVGRMF